MLFIMLVQSWLEGVGGHWTHKDTHRTKPCNHVYYGVGKFHFIGGVQWKVHKKAGYLQ